jgi:CheY-like chemotaxis protein
LALVLHELGTNARKHGALSNSHGLVSVRWQVQSNNGRNLQLSWREVGGPRVTAPTGQGFGSTLIENSLRAYGGEVTMTYAEDGVVCEISLPLSELTQPLGALARESNSFSTDGVSQGIEGKRILIVEDEPLIGMVLTDYLQDAGCVVAGPAQSADKALQMATDEALDAALVDGNLAGRRVDQIVTALRDRGIPFAFVTGYGRDALPAGFDTAPIIEKPFTEEQVTATLIRLLNNVVQLHAARQEG